MNFLLILVTSILLLFVPATVECAVVTHEPQAHTGNRYNAMRAAQLLNNHVIAPGEVFSFNKTLGDRTTGKGFMPGYAILDQKYVVAVGGGVCRTSTAVFQAALEIGLPIVERHPHRPMVAYTLPGRDATVSYPAVDLKFRNNTPQPLIMRTDADLERIKIVISPAIQIYFQGQPVGAGWLEEGRTTVYLRALAEALAATVEWKEGHAHINGHAVPPDICDTSGGSLTVSLRALAEMMGLAVGWEAGHVTIQTLPMPIPAMPPAPLPAPDLEYAL